MFDDWREFQIFSQAQIFSAGQKVNKTKNWLRHLKKNINRDTSRWETNIDNKWVMDSKNGGQKMEWLLCFALLVVHKNSKQLCHAQKWQILCDSSLWGRYVVKPFGGDPTEATEKNFTALSSCYFALYLIFLWFISVVMKTLAQTLVLIHIIFGSCK